MLAAPGPLPDGGDWVVEFAWEGLRCLAHVRPDRARLRTVNGRDVTSSFPELVEPLTRRAPRGGMVLDGTVVARRRGRPAAAQAAAAAHGGGAPLGGRAAADAGGVDRRRPAVGGRPGPRHPALPPAPGAARGARHLRAAGRGLPDVPGRGGRGRHAHRRGVRRRGAARPPPRRPVQGRAGGRGPGCGSRCAGRGRWSSGAGRRRTRTGRIGSVRCCSVCPTPSRTGGCATWAGPGSGRGRSSGRSRHSWRGCAAPTRRSARRCPPGSAATRSGPSPAWSGGSSSPTGRPTGGCASPRGAGSSRAARTPGGRCSARPTLPADPVAGAPVVPRQESRTAPPEPAQDIGPAAVRATEARRLEQHFVYNALNTIAALMRTDPARARELLLDFADLNRAADRPDGIPGTLGDELVAVRAYLQLEQARFGPRLQVEIAVDEELHALPMAPRKVLDAVRAVVQQRIEPRPGGGTVTVTAERAGAGCRRPDRRARRGRARRGAGGGRACLTPRHVLRWPRSVVHIPLGVVHRSARGPCRPGCARAHRPARVHMAHGVHGRAPVCTAGLRSLVHSRGGRCAPPPSCTAAPVRAQPRRPVHTPYRLHRSSGVCTAAGRVRAHGPRCARPLRPRRIVPGCAQRWDRSRAGPATSTAPPASPRYEWRPRAASRRTPPRRRPGPVRGGGRT